MGLVGCRPNPQATYEHAYQTFVHGDLLRSQQEAEQGYKRFLNSRPDWAWRFRILQAKALLWSGLYADVLRLLHSSPSRAAPTDAEILTLRGLAYARLHQFAEAGRAIADAKRLCQGKSDPECGDVIQTTGLVALEQAQFPVAQQALEESLAFARQHNDRFLEATSLLNLGAVFLAEEHFDQAIDWSDAARNASATLGARDVELVAINNIGWAYYGLGESEKALELFFEAEKQAVALGDLFNQENELTNIGYIYMAEDKLDLADRSFRDALAIAQKIESKEDIFNALRARALVSEQIGALDRANEYADQAISIARAAGNRRDELYPLLVKGLIAAKSHSAATEKILREVEGDEKTSPSLKWRAEHALAQFYDDENHSDKANLEYRQALATFESARSSLLRDDTKLPFFSNAASIYGDYVHFLVKRGKTQEALQWADFSRARTLAEGLGVLSKSSSLQPPTMRVQEIAQKVQGTVLFYWLGDKQSYLWAITPQQTAVFSLPPAPQIDATAQRYHKALGGPQDTRESVNQDGLSLYQMLVAPAQSLLLVNGRTVIIPDGSLNNVNFETLIVNGAKPHFWIEDTTITSATSLRLLASSYAREKRVERRLLLIGNSVAPSPKYPELPRAASQLERVAEHFPAAQRQQFTREEATPAAYLNSRPEQFSHIHFVAHGIASRLSPLDSAIILSTNGAQQDSFKLYARDIIRHPLRADLVIISACYGAGERTYSGEGLVGLSWAFLKAGAHNVIAALWDATDASTEQLMARFYDELQKGESPDRALRTAKLSLLRETAFRNPFYWAPFQLYAGSYRPADLMLTDYASSAGAASKSR